jgi:SAM-dependent methyltransferase
VSGLEQAEEAEFVRYLEAKKPIDDRALNGRVWEALSEALAARSSLQPLRVLELGCGIGTMLERALERRLFGRAARVEYTGLDISPGLLAAARRRLPAWAGRLGFTLKQAADHDELRRGDLRLQVQWVAADAFDFAGDPARAGAYDLLLAHAFLDLVDARRAVQTFLPLLRKGGLFYFSLVFDGATLFEPVLDPALDAQIERAYHQTMDRRVVAGQPSGHSRTGRLLFNLLPRWRRILGPAARIESFTATTPPENVLDHILSTIRLARITPSLTAVTCSAGWTSGGGSSAAQN